ncbi:MAG: DUF3391 domain-containing protein, partial [Sulfurimicrobium sp.]|nr:DUF3391 domain-containing protein [Sulfurimicrobium sp.]
MTSTDNTIYVTPEQLCVGLYIHLDLGWMDHPFPFSSFKIKNDEQLETIRQLTLPRIRVEPGKSACKPLPAVSRDENATAAPTSFAPVDAEAIKEKKQRIEQL